MYRLAKAAEHYAHWLLREHHYENEWFNVTEAEALAAVEHALRPEAMEAYDEREIIPSITLYRKQGELFSVRLPKGTTVRLRSVLGSEGHSDFIRTAVEAELKRRERKKPDGKGEGDEEERSGLRLRRRNRPG
jgi:hypothetical protein